MVCYTWHHQTSLPASNVILLPLLGAPLLHYVSPAIGIRDAPIRSHLEDTKYMHDVLEDEIKPSLCTKRIKPQCFVLYLYILLRSQINCSCFFFGDPLSKDGGVVISDGLDTRLVVHLPDQFLAAIGDHHICLALFTSLASEEILHIQTQWTSFIYGIKLCN
jgi:hypothetical protein